MNEGKQPHVEEEEEVEEAEHHEVRYLPTHPPTYRHTHTHKHTYAYRSSSSVLVSQA
jgi:hypothetical protein